MTTFDEIKKEAMQGKRIAVFVYRCPFGAIYENGIYRYDVRYSIADFGCAVEKAYIIKPNEQMIEKSQTWVIGQRVSSPKNLIHVGYNAVITDFRVFEDGRVYVRLDYKLIGNFTKWVKVEELKS